MSAVSKAPAPVRDSAPELRFAVATAEPLRHAATPTLKFGLEIEAPGGQAIRSLLLDVQIQIAARRRGYAARAQEQLLELFGTPERWPSTLRTLPWLRATLVVPPFTGASLAELSVPCTYDALCAYKARHAFESWEATIEALLHPGSEAP